MSICGSNLPHDLDKVDEDPSFVRNSAIFLKSAFFRSTNGTPLWKNSGTVRPWNCETGELALLCSINLLLPPREVHHRLRGVRRVGVERSSLSDQIRVLSERTARQGLFSRIRIHTIL
jgi:hypothetical protein